MSLCHTLTLTPFLKAYSCTALTFSVIGVVAVVGLGLSLVRLLLQTFVLSGQSVGSLLITNANSNSHLLYSSKNMAQKMELGLVSFCCLELYGTAS
jgi:hypothetical protein